MVLAQGLLDTDILLSLRDVLLPFILVFTIVFAVLQKVGLFTNPQAPDQAREKQRTKSFNAVIALVMGLGVVLPHLYGLYPPDGDIVNIMNQALPNVSIVVIAVVMALLIIGVFGKPFQMGGGSLSGWLAMIAFAIIIFIFGSAANWWQIPDWLYFLQDPQVMTTVIVILAFAIVIWFITKEPKQPDPNRVPFGQQVAKEFFK